MRRAWALAAVALMVASGGSVAGAAVPPGGLVTYVNNPLLGAQRLHAFMQQGGPTLIFSDDPELVPEPGILYQDSVSGAFRVFFDHVDAARTPLYFRVVVTNRGATPVHIEVGRAGEAGPARAVLPTGQAAEHAWMAATVGAAITLAPGQSAFLDPGQGRPAALPGQNESGIIDATASGNVLVAVVAERRPTPDISNLLVLSSTTPAGGFVGRGTFPHADITMQAYGNGGMQFVQVAAPLSYLRGYSAVDGVPTEDYGNYGVLYDMHVTVTSGQSEPLTAVFDPLGGPFSGAGLVGVGYTPGEVVDMPADGGFSPSPTAGILLGSYPLSAGRPLNLHVEWMPPSGSSLPASLLLESP